jgi:hypothetical protein
MNPKYNGDDKLASSCRTLLYRSMVNIIMVGPITFGWTPEAVDGQTSREPVVTCRAMEKGRDASRDDDVAPLSVNLYAPSLTLVTHSWPNSQSYKNLVG